MNAGMLLLLLLAWRDMCVDNLLCELLPSPSQCHELDRVASAALKHLLLLRELYGENDTIDTLIANQRFASEWWSSAHYATLYWKNQYTWVGPRKTLYELIEKLGEDNFLLQRFPPAVMTGWRIPQ
jgi:hypothetical protein